MSYSANWSYPTAVRFGCGRISELAEACRAAGMVRPLIVSDPGVAGLPIMDAAKDALSAGGMAPSVFADVDTNPTETNLAAGLRAYRDQGHDGVIAFGGGSAMDVGKLVAFMAGQSRPVWDFEDVGDWWTRADRAGIAPVVAVPTTAGTGSELGRAGVLTDTETHLKKIIFHPDMLPKVVICDPELTLGLPPAMTAGTGMDAFAHCFEAYSSPHFHPMSQGIALEGMRLVLTYLPRAFEDGSDIEARAQLLAAAGMGAVAFQKGLGAVHAISHPVGALFNTHHGTTNAVVLPAVIDFNRAEIVDRFADCSAYLGVDGGIDGVRERVVALNAHFGFPTGLAGLGVDGAKLDEMVPMVLADPSCGGNPRALTEETARALLEAAL